MDMEVCTTLGMLSPAQAQQLKKAGLTAYNHNLDTSREYYPKVRLLAIGDVSQCSTASSQVVTTRKYDERLETIEAVRAAGISVCSGGIIGLGEDTTDRVGLIWEMTQCVLTFVTEALADYRRQPRRMPEAPESFPVNALVPIPGTPLEENTRVTVNELLRCIATARIVLPT